jgi:hypothetical protein
MIYTVWQWGDCRYQFWREESHCSTKLFPSAEQEKKGKKIVKRNIRNSGDGK